MHVIYAKLEILFKDDWRDIRPAPRNTFLKKKMDAQFRSTPKRTPIESIDLSSDEDDVIIVNSQKSSVFSSTNGHSSSNGRFSRPSSPEHVLRDAKKTIKSYNRYFSNGICAKSIINESIRPHEQQVYRDMLLSSPSTAEVYGSSGFNFNVHSQRKLENATRESGRAQKILAMLRDKPALPLIDLAADGKKAQETITIKDDSDSSTTSSKRAVSPVNSLKKLLDIEPYMDPNYVLKLDESRRNKKKETERLIREERLKRDKFSNLNRENINLLLEQKFKNCRLSSIVVLDEYEEKLTLPELTPQQEAKINEAMNGRSVNRVFVEKFHLRITGHDLRTLSGKEWLNDEVINFYVNLIQERSKDSKLPSVYAFSTFFYPKLMSSGHSSLRRWTKKVDIFAHDLILVPVHLGFHWCMATIDFRDKCLRYYDSMLGHNMKCLDKLVEYLVAEHKDKKKTDYDIGDWKKLVLKDIPKQLNGSDCGVFACTFAEFVSRNAKILFTQEHMPYIRRKMCCEIMGERLLT